MINIKIVKCLECEYFDYNVSYGKCGDCHDGSNFMERYYWINKKDDEVEE